MSLSSYIDPANLRIGALEEISIRSSGVIPISLRPSVASLTEDIEKLKSENSDLRAEIEDLKSDLENVVEQMKLLNNMVLYNPNISGNLFNKVASDFEDKCSLQLNSKKDSKKDVEDNQNE